MGAAYKACNDPDFLQEYDSVSFELTLYDTTLGRLSFVSLESCCGAVLFPRHLFRGLLMLQGPGRVHRSPCPDEQRSGCKLCCELWL